MGSLGGIPECCFHWCLSRESCQCFHKPSSGLALQQRGTGGLGPESLAVGNRVGGLLALDDKPPISGLELPAPALLPTEAPTPQDPVGTAAQKQTGCENKQGSERK